MFCEGAAPFKTNLDRHSATKYKKYELTEHDFMMMFWIGIISAVIALAVTPLVRKWMHGVK